MHAVLTRSRHVTADAVADLIAARLAAGELACAVFADLLDRDITLHPLGPHERPATGPEAALLRLPPDSPLYVREGLLLAGTVICARVRLKLCQSRVRAVCGDTMWGRVWAGEPCGQVLAPCGLERIRRITGVPGDGGLHAVTSSAVLAVGVTRIGHAAEEVPWDLCVRLAG